MLLVCFISHLLITRDSTKLCDMECNGMSRVAQWKRAGPITQRSVDRNHALLSILPKSTSCPQDILMLNVDALNTCFHHQMYYNMCCLQNLTISRRCFCIIKMNVTKNASWTLKWTARYLEEYNRSRSGFGGIFGYFWSNIEHTSVFTHTGEWSYICFWVHLLFHEWTKL